MNNSFSLFPIVGVITSSITSVAVTESNAIKSLIDL